MLINALDGGTACRAMPCLVEQTAELGSQVTELVTRFKRATLTMDSQAREQGYDEVQALFAAGLPAHLYSEPSHLLYLAF